jgi:hypothetical protein
MGHWVSIMEYTYTHLGGTALCAPGLLAYVVLPTATRAVIKQLKINQAQEKMMQSKDVNMKCTRLLLAEHNTLLYSQLCF